MTLRAETTFIDRYGTVHQFTHLTDKDGDAYRWSDITGHQHCFLRGMTTSFDLWCAEVIRGICIAAEVIE